MVRGFGYLFQIGVRRGCGRGAADGEDSTYRLHLGNLQSVRSWPVCRGAAARHARAWLHGGQRLYRRISRSRGQIRDYSSNRSRTRAAQGRCSCLPLFGAIDAAKKATKAIPIIMITQVDPVAIAFVAFLAASIAPKRGRQE